MFVGVGIATQYAPAIIESVIFALKQRQPIANQS